MLTSFSRAPRARRVRRHHIVILALLVTASGFDARAETVLTLDDALRVAQGRSRLLLAQDSAVDASRNMAIAAGQLPDPTLKVGLNDLPVSGSDRFSLTRDNFTMLSVGLMQEFTRADKRQARSARFEREADVAEGVRVVALADLRRDTALAWFDLHFQLRMREVLLTARDEAKLQVEAADAVYRGGRGSQADAFASRSAVAQIDDRLLQVEQRILTARARLARWIGAEAMQPLGPPPDLAGMRLAARHLDADLAQQHPQLALMERQERVARAEADVARANKHSDWSVEVTYSQRAPAYSNFVSLNLSIPLQFDQANRQNRELSAKLALADQLRAQREEATRGHLFEVRSWLQEWQSNRDRLTHYDTALLPLTGERTRAALAAYRGGGGTLSGVLEARRLEIDAQIDRLRIEMETANLWVQLEYVLPEEFHAMLPQRSDPTATTRLEK